MGSPLDSTRVQEPDLGYRSEERSLRPKAWATAGDELSSSDSSVVDDLWDERARRVWTKPEGVGVNGERRPLRNVTRE